MQVIATKSDWNVEVVRVGPISKHPNADRLAITTVQGNPVVVKDGDFREGDLAVYIPVDSIVPVDKPAFSFLKSPRIRAARLRGVYSQGLLVGMDALPDASIGGKAGRLYSEGDNVAEILGVTKYLTAAERAELDGVKGERKPKVSKLGFPFPVYGLDPLKRFSNVLEPGTEVVLTEKIHGCNARYVYRDGRLYVGSHRTVRGATEHRIVEWLERMKLRALSWFGKAGRTSLIQRQGDVWWEVARKYELKEKLSKYPGFIFYGEIYGHGVQDLTYGSLERRFVVFDVFNTNTGRFLDYDDMAEIVWSLGLNTAPHIYRGPWSPSLVAEAEGETLMLPEGSGHIREGFVVRTAKETFHPNIGRVSLKCVGEAYHLRKAA